MIGFILIVLGLLILIGFGALLMIYGVDEGEPIEFFIGLVVIVGVCAYIFSGPKDPEDSKTYDPLAPSIIKPIEKAKSPQELCKELEGVWVVDLNQCID